jgi:hypothetical protein
LAIPGFEIKTLAVFDEGENMDALKEILKQ